MDNRTTTPLEPAVILTADQPLDDLAAARMQTLARKGRGFVLDTLGIPLFNEMERTKVRDRMAGHLDTLAAAVAKVTDSDQAAGIEAASRQLILELDTTMDRARGAAIQIIESPAPLPLIDEYEPPAELRAHTIHDTAAFIAYARRYGSQADSLVFVNESGATLTLKELIERGKREIVTMAFRPSEDWAAWSEILGEDTGHRGLVEFLRCHEHNLEDPTILMLMAELRLSSTVNLESIVSEDAKSFTLAVKTGGSETMKNFPKKFTIKIPVLEQDGATEERASAEISLSIQLPDEARGQPIFSIRCSLWRQILLERVRTEQELIQESLAGWTVIHGEHHSIARQLGIPKRP